MHQSSRTWCTEKERKHYNAYIRKTLYYHRLHTKWNRSIQKIRLPDSLSFYPVAFFILIPFVKNHISIQIQCRNCLQNISMIIIKPHNPSKIIAGTVIIIVQSIQHLFTGWYICYILFNALQNLRTGKMRLLRQMQYFLFHICIILSAEYDLCHRNRHTIPKYEPEKNFYFCRKTCQTHFILV